MKKALIAVIAIAACAAYASAANMELMKNGSVLLGYSSPGGNVGDSTDGGLAFGLDYDAYKINDTWLIGGSFVYAHNTGSPLGVDYTLNTWGLTPYAKASKQIYISGKKATLYGQLGLGFYGISQEASLGGISATSSDTKIGFNLGAGLMFPLKDNIHVGGDLRYHKAASNLSYLIPSAKLTYSF